MNLNIIPKISMWLCFNFKKSFTFRNSDLILDLLLLFSSSEIRLYQFCVNWQRAQPGYLYIYWTKLGGFKWYMHVTLYLSNLNQINAYLLVTKLAKYICVVLSIWVVLRYIWLLTILLIISYMRNIHIYCF